MPQCDQLLSVAIFLIPSLCIEYASLNVLAIALGMNVWFFVASPRHADDDLKTFRGMKLKSRTEEMNMVADLGANEVLPRGGLNRDGKAREQS
ncbi:hypothetical protein K1719_019349 [Acacia pycnantha]|nr:hypothetical protein K1719_029245 [Acacia pycnantha]KAI9109719.1 hypothetical protein K1719_019349 [Acacia pycnantha]